MEKVGGWLILDAGGLLRHDQQACYFPNFSECSMLTGPLSEGILAGLFVGCAEGGESRSEGGSAPVAAVGLATNSFFYGSYNDTLPVDNCMVSL